MVNINTAAAPTASFGYYRGAPKIGSTPGSGIGVSMAGTNTFAQGQGVGGTSSGWEPSILYMLVLIVGEMIVFGFIGRHL